MALPCSLHVLTLAGLGLLALALLFQIIALATPHWSNYTGTLNGYTAGLFEGCIPGAGCNSYTNTPSDVVACQAFAVMGFISGFGALALSIFHAVTPMLGRTQTIVIPKVALAAGSISSVFIFICAIIWGAKVYDSSVSDIGYSFGLSLVAAVLVDVGGVLTFLGAKRTLGSV